MALAREAATEMTKREYMATQFAAALCGGTSTPEVLRLGHVKLEIAEVSCELADMLCEVLSRRRANPKAGEE